MNVNKVLKRIINAIGIILLSIVVILNIIYTTRIRAFEYAETTKNSILMIVVVAFCVFLIYKLLTGSKIQIKDKNTKILILVVISIFYLIAQMIWIKMMDTYPNADQYYAYNFAKVIANIDGTTPMKIDLDYFAFYPFQINLSFIFAIIFKICHSTNVRILQVINAIANTLNILAIYLITKELGKKYNVNKEVSVFIYLIFTPVMILSTFVYGDFLSLNAALFAIYFIMKYTSSNDKKRKCIYLISSSLMMMLALFVRNNSIIIILAILIYLFLDLLKKEEKKTTYLKKIALMILFTVIAIMPSRLTQSYLLKKYNIESGKECTLISYLVMGIDRSPYGYGWYDNKYGRGNVNVPKEERTKEQLERLDKIKSYYKENPEELLRFYTYKEASMWCEPTFECLYDNIASFGAAREGQEYESFQKDEKLMEAVKYYVPYMKIVTSFIFAISLLVIINRRKNITNEAILLIVIFIGGFLFHTIWEAKSRYIILYVVILIPLCSIEIEKHKIKKLEEANTKK